MLDTSGFTVQFRISRQTTDGSECRRTALLGLQIRRLHCGHGRSRRRGTDPRRDEIRRSAAAEASIQPQAKATIEEAVDEEVNSRVEDGCQRADVVVVVVRGAAGLLRRVERGVQHPTDGVRHLADHEDDDDDGQRLRQFVLSKTAARQLLTFGVELTQGADESIRHEDEGDERYDVADDIVEDARVEDLIDDAAAESVEGDDGHRAVGGHHRVVVDETGQIEEDRRYHDDGHLEPRQANEDEIGFVNSPTLVRQPEKRTTLLTCSVV